MANLTRNLFIPYVDRNTILKAIGQEAGSERDWVRIDKSTVFDLAFNPQETTSGYIDTANDTTQVTSYQPELPQEIILDNSNPLFKIMFPFCMQMPTGADAVVPVLLRVPNMETAEPTDAYEWAEAIVSPTDLATVDGKLNFSLKLNGDAVKGTVADEDGKPKFTADPKASMLRFGGSEVTTTKKTSSN